MYSIYIYIYIYTKLRQGAVELVAPRRREANNVLYIVRAKWNGSLLQRITSERVLPCNRVLL